MWLEDVEKRRRQLRHRRQTSVRRISPPAAIILKWEYGKLEASFPLGQFHPHDLLYILPGISHMLAPWCNNFSAKDWFERRTIQPFKSNAFFYFTPSMGEGVFIATLSPSYPSPRLAAINEMHRKRITFGDLFEAALDVLFASRLRDRNPTDLKWYPQCHVNLLRLGKRSNWSLVFFPWGLKRVDMIQKFTLHRCGCSEKKYWADTRLWLLNAGWTVVTV